MIKRTLQPFTSEQRLALERMRPRWFDRALRRITGTSEEERRAEELRLRDLAQGQLELLEVAAARVLQIETTGAEGPIVLFESKETRSVIILSGPWLDDPHVVTFSAKAAEALRAPGKWFTDFTVERSPHLGIVFRVMVHGGAASAPSVPARVPFILECEVLAGTLEQLEDVFSHAALSWGGLKGTAS